jgi:hypothetical protein
VYNRYGRGKSSDTQRINSHRLAIENKVIKRKLNPSTLLAL